MTVYTAEWGGIWTLLLVAFVIIPSIRWSVGFGTKAGNRWGRRRGQLWGAWDGEPATGRASGREIATLRAELDAKLSQVDSLTSRVAELENRLDFAERLLAQRVEEPAHSANRLHAP